MENKVVAFRWRTTPDDNQCEGWVRDSTRASADKTVGDLRRRLAPDCGSTAALASRHDPELWYCDENGRPTKRDKSVVAEEVLAWTPATAPDTLFAKHTNKRPCAVLVFTFPPANVAPAQGTPLNASRQMRGVL
jgi:hypothetical protein